MKFDVSTSLEITTITMFSNSFISFTILNRCRNCNILNKKLNPHLYNIKSKFYCTAKEQQNVAPSNALLQGNKGGHKSIVVKSESNICKDITEFKVKLEASLNKWNSEKYKGVWFDVAIPQVEWIPILKEKGFRIHHASEDVIHLYYWLPKDETCKIPDYAHNMVGAGAAVINDKNQILVVRERFLSRPIWKLPGGYVDIGEDVGQAAIREVFEETGIRTEFVSLLGFRFVAKSIYNCSDMYFIVRLRPSTDNILKQEDEVEDCQWMNIEEFLQHKEVYNVLRDFVKQSIQNEKDGIVMTRTTAIHPIIKTPQLLFTITKSPNTS